MSAAASALPGRLAIQWNGVSDQATNPFVTTEAAALETLFGWQSNEWGGESLGAECGSSPSTALGCTHNEFETLLNNGIFPSGVDSPPTASYFELFGPNIIEYPGLAAYAHNSIY